MVLLPVQALTLGLWVQWPGGPVDLKSYWPPNKLTGPQKTNWSLPQTKLVRRKNICVNLQFAHRPKIKLFIMLVYRLMILHTIHIDDTLIGYESFILL